MKKKFRDLRIHIKRWNSWRKYNSNSWLHKILVLLGVIHSPTFGGHVVPLARGVRFSRNFRGQLVAIDEIHEWDDDVFNDILWPKVNPYIKKEEANDTSETA